MTNSISLYFHIPFCLKKCDYCAFFSLANQADEVKQAYYEALLRQISHFKTDKEIKSIYFGGGTPTTLGASRLCSLLHAVKQSLTLSQDCEITLEVNPKTVDLSSLTELRKSGFNRLSIGVQSADDSVLRSLGRVHSFQDALFCISDARKAGFTNVSADIIFALPYQTDEAFVSGIEKIVKTGVNHISAYSLQLEEGTPLYERASRLSFPDEDSEEWQYSRLCAILKENGFTHYEISSFAKNGDFSRHNLNYWACGEYFGFGAGAHSHYLGRRFSTPCDIDAFIEKSHLSLLAPTDFDASPILTEAEREEERIMLGLRTSFGVKIPDKKHHVGIKVASLGYGSYKDGVLSLNSRGFRVSNAIIAELLT